jgi:pilus assembly protein CpaE
VLIAPDRSLAEQFSETLRRSRTFQVVADLKSYPTPHALEMRLRQIGPDVILIDVATNPDLANSLIRVAAAFRPAVQVVGLSPNNDPALLMSALRQGASEFLHAPFAPEVQLEAVCRLLRLRQPGTVSSSQPANVIMFSSAKPGSGCSTLATQVAFALRRLTQKRILLADFDLSGGSVCFGSSKADGSGSLGEAPPKTDQFTSLSSSSLLTEVAGVHLLAWHDAGSETLIEPARIIELLDWGKFQYDYILLDLPVVFRAFSLAALSQADRALIVSTCELPSLHFARKTVKLFDHLGFPKEKFAIILNRVTRKDELGRAEIEKLFQCPVYARVPSDYLSLHRAVTLGKPLDTTCDLGKTLEKLASSLAELTANPGGNYTPQLAAN